MPVAPAAPWDLRDIELAGLRAEIKALRKDLEGMAELRKARDEARAAYSAMRHDYQLQQQSVQRLLAENIALQKKMYTAVAAVPA
jgi:serine phosphatase RsbU (regulator of sigma subunit)